MTHPGSSEHIAPGAPPHGVAAAAGPFTPTEVDGFRAEDRGAAAAIVILMAGIFTIGLIGYIGVCLWIG